MSPARIVVAAAVVLLATSACGTPGVTIIRGAELPEDVYGSPDPTPTGGADIPRRGNVWLVRNGRLKAVERPLPGVAASEAEGLLLALLQGPTGLRGYSTELPPETRLNSLEVDEGVATVDLSENFEQGPSRSLAMRVGQVVYTLTEDGRVRSVEFSFEGVSRAVPTARPEVLLSRVLRSDYFELTQPPPKG